MIDHTDPKNPKTGPLRSGDVIEVTPRGVLHVVRDSRKLELVSGQYGIYLVVGEPRGTSDVNHKYAFFLAQIVASFAGLKVEENDILTNKGSINSEFFKKQNQQELVFLVLVKLSMTLYFVRRKQTCINQS